MRTSRLTLSLPSTRNWKRRMGALFAKDIWRRKVERKWQKSGKHAGLCCKVQCSRIIMVRRNASFFFFFLFFCSIFYAEKGDLQAAGVVPVGNCTVALADENLVTRKEANVFLVLTCFEKGRKNAFVISTRYRNYFLVAKDEFELAKWMGHIEQVKVPLIYFCFWLFLFLCGKKRLARKLLEA